MYRFFKKHPVVIISAAIIAAACAFAAIIAFKKPVSNPASENEQTVTYTAAPSSTPIVKESYISTAIDDEPAVINLPSIGTEGFVQKVGIDQNGEVAVPTNVHLAGWFSSSAKPGQPGLSIIDGHVNGISTQAIFARLGELKPGNQFEIFLANNTKLQYEVMTSKTITATEAPTHLFSQNPSVKNQLNLVTCAGTYNQKTGNYDKRLIVSARQLN